MIVLFVIGGTKRYRETESFGCINFVPKVLGVKPLFQKGLGLPYTHYLGISSMMKASRISPTLISLKRSRPTPHS